MQQIAASWLVYRLTDSAFMLGLVGFTGQIPTFIFSSFAGVYADRWNRRRFIIATQTLAMIQAFVLAFLTLSGHVQVWHLLVLSGFLGLINAFDIPARQSFVVDLIEDRENLGNAIALNSFIFNGARLIGPSLAGLLIVLFGEGICFLINGISFIGIVMALLAIQVADSPKAQSKGRFWQDLLEGYAYAFGFTPIRAILLQLALISFMGVPYSILMPVFARDILDGGSFTLGILIASSGFGALTGAAFLAARRTILGLGRLIAFSSGCFGIAVFIFALSRSVFLSLIMLYVVGFGMIVQMAASNTVLQSIVDDEKRGRVMSLFAIAGMGMVPFGSLFAGAMASRIGAPQTVMICGAVCMIGALIFAGYLPRIREKIRPVYVQKGIINDLPSE
jgi:MFS family permease